MTQHDPDRRTTARPAPPCTRRPGRLARAWIAAALAAGAAAVPAVHAAQDPAQVDKGKARYTSSCARCHGLNLVTNGAIGFDLRRFPPDDKERFVRSVSKGLRAMPAWETILQPGEIDALWAYVMSVQEAAQ